MFCGSDVLRVKRQRRSKKLSTPPSFTEFTLSHSDLAQDPTDHMIDNELYLRPQSDLRPSADLASQQQQQRRQNSHYLSPVPQHHVYERLDRTEEGDIMASADKQATEDIMIAQLSNKENQNWVKSTPNSFKRPLTPQDESNIYNTPIFSSQCTPARTRNSQNIYSSPVFKSQCTPVQDRSRLSQCTPLSASKSIMSSCMTSGYESDVGSVLSHSRGQLKLAITADSNNAIQVHVVEAANLRSRWKDLCDPYIQLQVCPDENCSKRYQSTTLNNTNSPYYDSTFNIALDGVDKQQRLVISAWHKDMEKNCGEFLGCMSFGMKHLIHKVKRKKVEGWYHLLSENIGHRKHLSVEPSSEPSTPSKLARFEHEQTIVRRESFSVVLHRTGSGYGFTVRGSCPVKVGRVKENGPAHLAGLRRGDYIVKINGQNVCRSSAESVASVVRHAENMVVLDLYRGKSHRVDSSCASSRASSIPSLDLNHAILERQDENKPPALLNISVRNVIGASCKDIVEEQAHELKSEDSCKWDPEISAIESINSTFHHQRLQQSAPRLRNYISVPSLSEVDEDSHVTIATDASDLLNEQLHDTTWNDDSILASEPETSYAQDCSMVTDTELPWQPNCSMSEFDAHCSLDTVRREVLSGGSSAECSVQQLDHVPSLASVLRLEQDYSVDLQKAIQSYSRPLRHCLVSPKQHQQLFQNMEKMAAISGFISKQLEHESPAQVYASRVSMICESLETYLSGIPEAHELLSELQSDPEFHQFLTLTAQSCGLDLADVITRPVDHLASLISRLQVVQSEAPKHSSDAMQLSMVISELQTTQARRHQHHHSQSLLHTSSSVNAGSLGEKSLTRSMVSGLMDFTRHSTVSTSVSMSEDSSSRRSANSTVDADVLDLQSRLTIPRHIKRFKLSSSKRHLIYSGNLTRIQDGRLQTVHVLLLSDLMLVTRETDSGKLVLLEEPLLLDNMATQWSHTNECDFGLRVMCARQTCQLLFRAQSTDEKCAWKSILQHRISLNHSNQADVTTTLLDIL